MKYGGHESPGRRILVVDDNRDAADSLAKYLKRVAGHHVEVAYDGPEALALARTFRVTKEKEMKVEQKWLSGDI